MKSTFKILFYLKRGAIRANGCALIMGRITVDGVGTQFSTKLEVKPEEWALRQTGQPDVAMPINRLILYWKKKRELFHYPKSIFYCLYSRRNYYNLFF